MEVGGMVKRWVVDLTDEEREALATFIHMRTTIVLAPSTAERRGG